MRRHSCPSLLPCLALLPQAAFAQSGDYEVRTAQGRTSAGAPFVDVEIRNVSGDSANDFVDFSWDFRRFTDTLFEPAAGMPEEVDFQVTRWPTDWGANPGVTWGGPLAGPGVLYRVSPSAPLPASTAGSFRVEYVPFLGAGDVGDPNPAELQFRDKPAPDVVQLVVRASGAVDQFTTADAAFTVARQPEHERIPTAGNRTLLDLDADAGRQAVLYLEGDGIACATSIDDGLSWQETTISTQPGIASLDVLAQLAPEGRRLYVHGSHLYAAWRAVEAGNSQYFVGRSTDGGQSWSLPYASPVGLSVPGSASAFELAPGQAGSPDQDHLVLVFEQRVEEGGTTFEERRMAISEDGGATFAERLVSRVDVAQQSPSDLRGLALTENSIYLAVFGFSTLAGSSETRVLSSSDGWNTVSAVDLDGQGQLAIGAGDDTVVVVLRTGAFGSFVADAFVSTDSGASFVQTRLGNFLTPGTQFGKPVQAEVVSGVPVAFWHRSDGEYVASRSTDGGLSWSDAVVPVDPGGFSAPADLERDGDVLTCIYNRTLSYSTDGGATWEPPIYAGLAYIGGSVGSAGTPQLNVAYDLSRQRIAIARNSPPPLTGGVPANMVWSYPVGEASGERRSAGGNVDTLSASSLVDGDWLTVDLDLASTGHALGFIAVGTTPAEIPLPASANVLLLADLGPSFFVTPDASRLWLQIPDLFAGSRVLQAAHVDPVLPLLLTNAVDLQEGLEY